MRVFKRRENVAVFNINVKLTSKGCAYSQSRPHTTPKLDKETPDAYEARTWHQRIHLNHTGAVVIPAMALQNCLAEAAKFLSIQIPGKGKATYTKHFESGIQVMGDMVLYAHDGSPIVPPTEAGLRKVLARTPMIIETEDIKKALEYAVPNNEVWGDWVFVPADGIAGSGKRVWKCYPIINNWTTTTEIIVSDSTITKEVLLRVMKEAGNLIGMGRFRVRNRGTYGRFEVAEI